MRQQRCQDYPWLANNGGHRQLLRHLECYQHNLGTYNTTRTSNRGLASRLKQGGGCSDYLASFDERFWPCAL